MNNEKRDYRIYVAHEDLEGTLVISDFVKKTSKEELEKLKKKGHIFSYELIEDD